MKVALVALFTFVAFVNATHSDGSRTMRDLFKLYSERVYGKKYDLIRSMYDINGVTVEGGKRAFFGPEAISNAIRGYHNELGEGKNTLNFNERFEQLGDNLLYYYSDYKTDLSDRTIEGHYWQIWKKSTDGSWKIIHDEFTIRE
ncbi:hypothetical protein WR25_21340 [Diploscapter pachys]|uniref:DUF4440 domain-containing protein n=1 Tax=Diploscapter pachys TaxID=2018661 RepID=A0A2A2KQV2_9BILA|nr:hypothetical protein WR25_21340 [Diploscapter pachys]